MVEYKHFNNPQDWLDFRSGYISSTESAALFGVSPYLTEFELYHSKASSITVPFQTNDRIELGNYLEEGIARFTAAKIGCTVEPFKAYAYDDQLKIGSSFDYQITSGDLNEWLMEVKSVDYIQHRDTWVDGEPPFHIIVQVQHQLELTQRAGCLIAALVGGNDLQLIEMPRDPQFGRMLSAKVKAFWRNVQGGKAPEPDFEKDAKIIAELYKKTDDGKTIEACQQIMELAIIYDAARDNEQKAKLKKEATKAELLTIMDKSEIAYWAGGKVSLKPNKKGSRVLNVKLK